MRETEMEPGYYEEEGLGMAGNSYKHQNIISRLCNNIVNRFPELEGHLRSETNVIDIEGTKDKRYPDITIWETEPGDIDAEPENLLMIIEITNSAYFDERALGCIKDAYGKHPEMQEAFIYNYTDKTWKRYTNSKIFGVKKAISDESIVLGVGLNEILYNNVYYFKNYSFIKYSEHNTENVYYFKNYSFIKYSERNAEEEVFNNDILEILKTNLQADLTRKKNNFRTDIVLENHLITKDEFMPVISYWEIAKSQDRNFYLENLLVLVEITEDDEKSYWMVESSFRKCKSLYEVLVYNLDSENWTRYTYDFIDGLRSEQTSYSKVLNRYMNNYLYKLKS